MYVLFVKADGRTECLCFCIKNVADATAVGIKAILEKSFIELDVEEWQSKLVGMCVDGAAVNLGIRCGLVARIREDLPWLVAIHCLNHRLELAAIDAFAKTYMDEVSSMLVDLYYLYGKSPKRLRQLRELGEILEEAVRKPERAHGTKWLQHRSRALKSLIIRISCDTCMCSPRINGF